MQYRKLGNTGLEVSCIGLGCAVLGYSTNAEYGARLVRRAFELGISYFDVARGYHDAEVKVGEGLKGTREEAVISTKTGAKTRDDAWRQIHESLERLQTDYVDNCHLHGLRAGEDLETRLGPGGALEALREAKDQGLIRHIGCTSHRSDVLIEALERFDFEVILVPMNIVEREPLEELIPLCQQRRVGVTIMKPVATGLLPAALALKWLLNQPMATAVPGAATLEELEEDARIGGIADPSLTAQEQAEVAALQEKLDHVRCRLCGDCEPCPKGIPMRLMVGTDIPYDHYRNMGRAGFRSLPWSKAAIQEELERRESRIAAVRSCDRCGECEARCPYGLPIVEMLQGMLPAMEDMVSIYHELLDR